MSVGRYHVAVPDLVLLLRQSNRAFIRAVIDHHPLVVEVKKTSLLRELRRFKQSVISAALTPEGDVIVGEIGP